MTRILSEAEYVALPNGLTNGRNAAAYGVQAFTSLAALLEAAGYSSSGQLAHLSTLLDAARAEAATTAHTEIAAVDPETMTPEQAAQTVRTGSLLLLRSFGNAPAGSGSLALELLEKQLLPYARQAFSTLADEAVEAMRAEFEIAVACVVAAHDAGLTPDHTAEQIAQEGTPEQVIAFRELGHAVATLDRIAGLRIQVANLVHEPSVRDALDSGYIDKFVIASFLTDITDLDSLDGAVGRFTGNVETVIVSSPVPSNGPAVKRVARPRLGGAWLSLIGAGYQIRLNTPAEVTELLAAKD